MKASELFNGDKPFAYVEMEKDHPPYAHIWLRVTMPSKDYNTPRVMLELTAQVGTDGQGTSDIGYFAQPYAIEASIASKATLEVATVGIKYLRAFHAAVTKYEEANQRKAPFTVQAQILMEVCKCSWLIHEPDNGWRFGHDMSFKAASPRGVTSREIIDEMVGKMECFVIDRR